MSLRRKRTLNDRTNDNKRVKYDSAIDLTFDIEELKSQTNQSFSSISKSSVLNDNDDDNVFEDQSKFIMNENQGRKRLNGTSSYRTMKKENKHPIKLSNEEEKIRINQTLKQLLEEQARIDAHSLSIHMN